MTKYTPRTVSDHLKSAGVYAGTSKAISVPLGVILAYYMKDTPIEVTLAITALIDVGINLLLVIIKKKFLK